MRENDARRLTHPVLTELRKRAVTSIQEGQVPSDVANAFGVTRAAVYGWLARYRNGGWDALNARKRGGRPPLLDGKALDWIYRTVSLNNPLQLKFTFALWTARMIGTLIEDRFGVRLSKASVCRLLIQMGLTPQRPVWRAYQQKQGDVERWLNEEYPRIRAKAKRVNARIFFGDEAGVRSDHHAGTTWAPRGKTPVVSSTGARFGLNMISAVSAQGEFRFMVLEVRVAGPQFIEFLRRLLHNADRPIFLIVDRHPVHRAAAVRKFVEAQEGRLELFFLPPYSPELNPDERVWNDVKNNAIGRKSITGAAMLKAEVVRHMRSVQKTPDRVGGYFRNEETKYAA